MSGAGSHDHSYWSARSTLLGELRARPLDALQIASAARALYGDANLFQLYGLDLHTLSRRRLVVLGRTILECCVDAEARPVAEVTAGLWRRLWADEQPTIVDAFAGSANLLFWLTRSTGMIGVGFEADDGIYHASRRNLLAVGANATLVHEPYPGPHAGGHATRRGGTIYLFDPPWGDAFDRTRGLDLTATRPPVDVLLESARRERNRQPALAVVKACETLTTASARRIARHGAVRAVERGPQVAAGPQSLFLVLELRD